MEIAIDARTISDEFNIGISKAERFLDEHGSDISDVIYGIALDIVRQKLAEIRNEERELRESLDAD